ncbi:hypothetical protein F5Y16DRAFT_260166 [Xylariaceae sp. FL0255]|nr:hypothetical protein F5Y16DRAFT_260166 [Xylariaceae sp. FL0255]
MMELDHSQSSSHPSQSPHPPTPTIPSQPHYQQLQQQQSYSRQNPPPPLPAGATFPNHISSSSSPVDGRSWPGGGRVMGAPRPKGVHTKHLTELERFRIRTLYYDACLTKRRIREITGYSESQIRTAVRAKTAAPGKRPGRPRKNGGKAPPPIQPPSEAEANALLVLQAQQYFAEREGGLMDEDDEDDEDGDGDGDDEPMSPFPVGNMTRSNQMLPSHFSSPTTPISPYQNHHPYAPPFPVIPAQPVSTSWSLGKSIPDLPRKIRLHIWRAVLQFLPSQSPHARTWAVSVRSEPPFLELGTASPPPPVQLLPNPPWAEYVSQRHVPAMALARTNREARAVVLERLTPVVVSPGIGGGRQGIPAFVWVDRVCDFVHFDRGESGGGEGEDDSELEAAELFEKAGRVAFPEGYR